MRTYHELEQYALTDAERETLGLILDEQKRNITLYIRRKDITLLRDLSVRSGHSIGDILCELLHTIVDQTNIAAERGALHPAWIARSEIVVGNPDGYRKDLF